jgi:hypothetical protein
VVLTTAARPEGRRHLRQGGPAQPPASRSPIHLEAHDTTAGLLLDILAAIPEIASRLPDPALVLKAPRLGLHLAVDVGRRRGDRLAGPLSPEPLPAMLVDSVADLTLGIHRSSRSLA